MLQKLLNYLVIIICCTCIQFLEDLFDLNVVFNMSSVHVVVPAFKIQILRDFSKLEKQVALVFEEPIEKQTV